ncbi:MAG: putative ABC exporter domain-containing protein, partial [Isosphaeraceae bacterium]
MDRSLWLLIRLRHAGAVRRWFRNLRSVKRALLAVVGSLVFMPMFFSVLFNPRGGLADQVETVRLYGPLALLAYCALNVLLSTGDQALYYSPAEVGFLFPGPYRPRQLVLYKIATGLTGTLITAIFLSFAFAQHTPRYLSGLVGLSLAIQFLNLFSIVIGLATNVVGAMAFSRGRRLFLGALAGLAVVVLLPMGRDLTQSEPSRILERAMESPVLNVVLLPFQPAVLAFTSREFWPELVVWSLVALAINALMVGLILRLNAQFYEASAASSARIYDRLQRRRQGPAFSTSPSSARWKLPMAPWWGGAGPNLWRQFTTLLRTPTRLVGLAALLILPAVLMVAIVPRKSTGPPVAIFGLTMLSTMALVAPSMVGFDFRTDLDRMESLKTLPIPASRLAVGQLLAPALLISVMEWITLAILISVSPEIWGWLVGLAALLAPLNVLLITIENVYFLWFPFRMNSSSGVDFQAMGRQLILFSAKFLSAGLAAGLAAVIGEIGRA